MWPQANSCKQYPLVLILIRLIWTHLLWMLPHRLHEIINVLLTFILNLRQKNVNSSGNYPSICENLLRTVKSVQPLGSNYSKDGSFWFLKTFIFPEHIYSLYRKYKKLGNLWLLLKRVSWNILLPPGNTIFSQIFEDCQVCFSNYFVSYNFSK